MMRRAEAVRFPISQLSCNAMRVPAEQPESCVVCVTSLQKRHRCR
jgi:hypothetical protein